MASMMLLLLLIYYNYTSDAMRLWTDWPIIAVVPVHSAYDYQRDNCARGQHEEDDIRLCSVGTYHS